MTPKWAQEKFFSEEELFVERDDFMAEPVKKYFRLFPGNQVRFKKCILCEMRRL